MILAEKNEWRMSDRLYQHVGTGAGKLSLREEQRLVGLQEGVIQG
jgi:hypothetical protein